MSLRREGERGMAARMRQRAPLDNPVLALFVWGRFRRLMRVMLAVTVAVVILAGVLLYRHGGRVPVNGVIAAALGIALVMLLASACMGLMFLRRMALSKSAAGETTPVPAENASPE